MPSRSNLPSKPYGSYSKAKYEARKTWKLSDEDKEEVTRLLGTNAKQRAIAKQFGVSESHISRLAKGLKDAP